MTVASSCAVPFALGFDPPLEMSANAGGLPWCAHVRQSETRVRDSVKSRG
jgi:hypothetical protein